MSDQNDDGQFIKSRMPDRIKGCTLILTVGLPRSGKSTWSASKGFPVVNPDSIRIAMHGRDFIKEMEWMIWGTARTMVKSLFFAGHKTVILDSTAISRKVRDEWQNDFWEVKFMDFRDVSVTECVRRANEEGKTRLGEVILRMAKALDSDQQDGSDNDIQENLY